MPQLTLVQIVVAALTGLLLAVIVGYYLRQGRVNELTEALQQSQKRQEELEKEHEQRLRTATQQLQKDYEAQLAEKMEQYEERLEERLGQLESEYRTRQSVMGGAPVDADSTTEQRIRKQYETRLKEAATKIQQAYEQHLQDKLVEARSQAQQDYDQRLAEAIAHYQDQEQTRQPQTPGAVALGALMPEPTAVAGVDTAAVAEVEARLQAEYDQRLAQIQQDYEARLTTQGGGSVPAALDPSAAELELNLRRELEDSLRAEYEQKLAEKIEHYQDELTQRTQELEQAYEARLQLQVAPFSSAPAPIADEPAFDLDSAMLEAMPPEGAIADEAALIADSEISLDMNEFSSAAPLPELDAGNSDPMAWVESEADSGQADDLGLDADANGENLDVDAAFIAPSPAIISDLSELNFDDADDFSSESTPPGVDPNDVGLAALVEDETDSGQLDQFGLEPAFDTDSPELGALTHQPDAEPSFELATDEFAPEVTPSFEESGLGLTGLRDSELDSNQVDDLGLDAEFNADSLDLNALLNEPASAPGSEFEIGEFAAETAPASEEGDFGLAGLLDSEPYSGQVDDLGLDADFNADSLDLNALLNEPTSAPSSEFAIDEFAPEAASSELEQSDFGLASLLEGEADSGQLDDFGLDNDFNTDNLDLDALLNPPAPEPTSDELLDDLDDLSNLS